MSEPYAWMISEWQSKQITHRVLTVSERAERSEGAETTCRPQNQKRHGAVSLLMVKAGVLFSLEILTGPSVSHHVFSQDFQDLEMTGLTKGLTLGARDSKITMKIPPLSEALALLMFHWGYFFPPLSMLCATRLVEQQIFNVFWLRNNKIGAGIYSVKMPTSHTGVPGIWMPTARSWFQNRRQDRKYHEGTERKRTKHDLCCQGCGLRLWLFSNSTELSAWLRPISQACWSLF